MYVPGVVGEIDGDKFRVTKVSAVSGVTDALPPEIAGTAAPAGIDFNTI